MPDAERTVEQVRKRMEEARAFAAAFPTVYESDREAHRHFEWLVARVEELEQERDEHSRVRQEVIIQLGDEEEQSEALESRLSAYRALAERVTPEMIEACESKGGRNLLRELRGLAQEHGFRG